MKTREILKHAEIQFPESCISSAANEAIEDEEGYYWETEMELVCLINNKSISIYVNVKFEGQGEFTDDPTKVTAEAWVGDLEILDVMDTDEVYYEFDRIDEDILKDMINQYV